MATFIEKMWRNPEYKYIIITTAFSVVYFMFLLQRLSDWLNASSPYTQFILLYLGVFLTVTILFKGLSLGTKVSAGKALELLPILMGIDLLAPDYHVNFFTGELVSGSIFGQASTDYVIGYFATNIGLTGFLVGVMTYIFAPFLLFLFAAKLKKNFVKFV